MSTGCLDCWKPAPANEQLAATRQAAQQYANENDLSQAIYYDGNTYAYISADYAYENNYTVITVVYPDNGTSA